MNRECIFEWSNFFLLSSHFGVLSVQIYRICFRKGNALVNEYAISSGVLRLEKEFKGMYFISFSFRCILSVHVYVWAWCKWIRKKWKQQQNARWKKNCENSLKVVAFGKLVGWLVGVMWCARSMCHSNVQSFDFASLSIHIESIFVYHVLV